MNHQRNYDNTPPSKHFQDFLEGRLSEAEVQALFQRAQEEDFKRRFKEKLAATVIEAKAVEAIDNQPIIEINPQLDSVNNPMRVLRGGQFFAQNWAKAASVFLIFGIGMLFFYPSKPSYLDLQTLYATEMPAYDNTKKSSDANFDALEAAAKQAYAKKDFKTSENYLKQIIASGKGDSDHYFYLGLCLSKTQPPFLTEAIQALTEAKNLRQGLQDKEIRWHLALLYIQNKQFDAAKAELNVLKGKYKSEEVQKLLNVLPLD